MRGRDPLDGVLDPPLAELVEVRHERDGDGPVRSGADVEDTDVGAALVGDPAVRQRRRLHLVVAMFRMLRRRAAPFVHRPEVHDAVAIAREVDAALPEHGCLAGAGVVGGQRRRLPAGGRESPEVLGRAALVTSRVAALERQAREDDRAGLVERAVGGLGERHDRAGAGPGVEPDELRVRQRGVLARRKQHLARGSPRDPGRPARIPRLPDRHTAVERQGVDLTRSFVRGCERQRLSVRRDRGPALFLGMGCQALRDAAGDRDPPQVSFGHEDERVVPQGRLTVVAERGPLRRQGRSRDDGQHEGETSPPPTAHGRSSVPRIVAGTGW